MLILLAALLIGAKRQRQLQRSSLDDCLAHTGATLIYRSNTSSAYEGLSTPFALGKGDYRPAVLVLPSSAQQVAGTVKCVGAEKGKAKLTVVSGGHNYGMYIYAGTRESVASFTNMQLFESCV